MISFVVVPFHAPKEKDTLRDRLLKRYQVDLAQLLEYFFDHYAMVREHAPIELVERLHIPKYHYHGLSFKESAEFDYLLATAFGRLYAMFDTYLEPLGNDRLGWRIKRFLGGDVVLKPVTLPLYEN